MTVRDNLIATKDHFHKYGAKSIQAAFMGAVRQDDPFALATLVALRDSLPDGYQDFRDFESSRNWRAKDAYKVFDRAIEANK